MLQRGVGHFLDEHVRLAVDDAVALLDSRATDGLSQVALAGARRAEHEHILALTDKARGGQLVDERTIHLLVEIEIKVVERAARVAERGQLGAAGKQPVLPPQQLVGDERRDEVDGRQLVGLRLAQPRFQDIRHSREAELAQSVVEFDGVHFVSSPVLRWMSSR